jgi:phosphatidylserine/phosphatidylglycerophosphate/cardiolipin synthase-like enzyme
VPRRGLAVVISASALTAAAPAVGALSPGTITVLPQDGRGVYLDAFAEARSEIRIEICVLEDPVVLGGLEDALARGVRVRAIVDRGKYAALTPERANLAARVVAAGGRLHLSNPVFPRSFPKVILIDGRRAVVGSACLDSKTFARYRDYAYVTDQRAVVRDLGRLFEGDWRFSRPPGVRPVPAFNPTPPLAAPDLMVGPVTATSRLVAFVQRARRTLDVTTELLGNPTLEGELAAAVTRGVRVRLISPLQVNGGSAAVQRRQGASLRALAGAGVRVHVTRRPESAARPYMHARSMVADGRAAYLGSISLSPDSATANREVGLVIRAPRAVRRLADRFAADFAATRPR